MRKALRYAVEETENGLYRVICINNGQSVTREYRNVTCNGEHLYSMTDDGIDFDLFNSRTKQEINGLSDIMFYKDTDIALIERNGKYALLDSKGNIVNGKWANWIDNYSFGVSVLGYDDGVMCFVHSTERLILNEYADGILPFTTDGTLLALIFTGNNGEGYIYDIFGNRLNETPVYDIDENMDGTFAVLENGEGRMINYRGEFV